MLHIYRLYSSTVISHETLPHNNMKLVFWLLFVDTNRSSPLLPIIQPLISAKFWTVSFNNSMRQYVIEFLHLSAFIDMTYIHRQNVKYIKAFRLKGILQYCCIPHCYHIYSQKLISLWLLWMSIFLFLAILTWSPRSTSNVQLQSC